MFKRILFLLLLSSSTYPLWSLTSSQKFKSPRSEVSLISSVDTHDGTQRSIYVALAFKLSPHWHIYWNNSGDSGTPPALNWEKSSEGLSFSAIQWPRPQRISAPPLMTYGYEDEAILPVEIKIPADFNQDLKIELEANWLICKVECLPEQQNFSLVIPKGAQLKVSQEAASIQKGLSKLPEKLPLLTASLTKSPQNFSLSVSSPVEGIFADLREAYFFSDEGLRVKHAAAQVLKKHNNESFSLEIPRDDNDDDTKTHLSGFIELIKADSSGNSNAMQSVQALQIDTASMSRTSSDSFSLSNFALSILFSFLGGMILNLMPCVFPVLFLKVYALTKTQAADRKKEAWAYTAGVVVSFWALAAVLVILKSTGVAVGWGFQLQNPTFIALAFLVFVALGLSLLGVFEFNGAFTGAGNSLTQKKGSWGSFFTGVLATLVATPCSAPFMGAAVGYALTRQTWEAFPIFTFLGLGLALPYLVLAYFPRTLAWMPKPGVWMERLKEFFGFALFATALWLLWILGQQQGSDAVTSLLAAGLALGLALWALRLESPIARYSIIVLASILGTFALKSSLETNSSSQVNSQTKTGAKTSGNFTDSWEKFSPETLESYLARGEAVFIDFTASWCLTCQVNKKLVLNTAAATKLFEKNKVHVMRADWTQYDPVITQSLSGYARQSVPTYVYYAARQRNFKILPELLSLNILEEAIQNNK